MPSYTRILQSAAAATGNGTVIDARDYDSVVVQITGTFVGTVTWESSTDATTWAGLDATLQSSGVAAATATAVGIYRLPGGTFLRARISAYTSGSITATATADDTVGPAVSLGSGTATVGTVLLGAGTAEIGKLAAGTAEIGKLAAGTANIGDIDVLTLPELAAGTQFIGKVAKEKKIVSSTITFTDTNARATGDYCGTDTTPQAFTSVNRVSAGTVRLNNLVVISELETTPVALELWLFSATFTAPADNAAWTVSDADVANCVGVIKIASTDFVLSAVNGVATVSLDILVKPAAQSLFYALVARGTTPAWTTADGVILKLGVESD